jgi:hypothetical protein
VVTLFESAPHHERVVFRFEAADVQKIAFRFEAELCQSRALSHFADGRSVGNEPGVAPVARPVVVANALGIRDDFVGAKRGQRLGHQIPAPGRQVPLLPVALDAVHIERDAHAREARKRREERVRGIAEQGHVVRVAQQVQGGNEGVMKRFQVLVAQRRQATQMDAAPVFIRVRFAAIYRNVVAAQDQTSGEFLGEGFETTVTRRNAARSENCNPHDGRLGGTAA